MSDLPKCTCPDPLIQLHQAEATVDLNCQVHGDDIRLGLAVSDLIAKEARRLDDWLHDTYPEAK